LAIAEPQEDTSTTSSTLAAIRTAQRWAMGLTACDQIVMLWASQCMQTSHQAVAPAHA
jgi:hypothetical protein